MSQTDGQTSYNSIVHAVPSIAMNKTRKAVLSLILLGHTYNLQTLCITVIHCYDIIHILIPCIWNNLPASLRDKEVSCTEFSRQLKTFMFQTDCGASLLFWLLRLINTLTYLLTYVVSWLDVWPQISRIIQQMQKLLFALSVNLGCGNLLLNTRQASTYYSLRI